MDFIPRRTPYARHPFNEAMECDVSDVRHSSFGSPQLQDTEIPLDIAETNPYPTPGEIIGQIARVIAVCLGLGLVARVLVTFIGAQ